MRHSLVVGTGLQTIDAGQIDEENVALGGNTSLTGALLDGDTREVSDFLTKAGEAVEESRFTGIGRTDECDCVTGIATGRRRRNI
jgi:hypothetical protein